jgi:hypothetical protein
MSAMTKSEREDLQRLIRQREKVQKSNAKLRSADLLADFENQMAAQYAFDDDAVWAEAFKAVQVEVSRAEKRVKARCQELGIPERFAPSLYLSWCHRGYDNAVEKRRNELRRVAKAQIEALEQRAVVQIEQARVNAQTELAVAGLTSEAARAFVARFRSRLWYWLDRPVSDEEAKRWLEASPVDRSLFNPIQAHYVAAPIFDPPELDPVPARSGWYWRLVDAVAVPALPEPPPPPTPAPPTIRWSSAAVDVDHHLARRAEAYADACLRSVQTAPAGERHNTMRNVAITLFGMAEHGLLEEAAVWTVMISTADALRWDRRRADHLLAWCRAFAAEKRPLPKGLQ